MDYNEAKNLISGVLNNQKLTIAEHTRVQQAWQSILNLADQANGKDREGVNNGNDAVPVQRAVQPSQ